MSELHRQRAKIDQKIKRLKEKRKEFITNLLLILN